MFANDSKKSPSSSKNKAESGDSSTTNKERVKKLMKLYKLNQATFSLIAGFLVVIILAVLVVGYSFVNRSPQNENGDQVADQMPQDRLVQELPSSVSYVSDDSGQLTPEGLPVTYRVQAGDSTWKIAEAFYGNGQNFVDIEVANGLEPEQMLEVGQELLIPRVPVRGQSTVVAQKQTATPRPDFMSDDATVSTATTEATEGQASQNQESQPDEASDSSEYSQYIVQCGDSLWRIAEMHYNNGFEWTKIYNANKEEIGQNPDLIYPDQTFILP